MSANGVNGKAKPRSAAYRAIVGLLPKVSDEERGLLRAMLVRPQWVSRDREPKGPVGSSVVQGQPYVTEVLG